MTNYTVRPGHHCVSCLKPKQTWQYPICDTCGTKNTSPHDTMRSYV